MNTVWDKFSTRVRWVVVTAVGGGVALVAWGWSQGHPSDSVFSVLWHALLFGPVVAFVALLVIAASVIPRAGQATASSSSARQLSDEVDENNRRMMDSQFLYGNYNEAPTSIRQGLDL